MGYGGGLASSVALGSWVAARSHRTLPPGVAFGWGVPRQRPRGEQRADYHRLDEEHDLLAVRVGAPSWARLPGSRPRSNSVPMIDGSISDPATSGAAATAR